MPIRTLLLFHWPNASLAKCFNLFLLSIGRVLLFVFIVNRPNVSVQDDDLGNASV